MRLDGPTQADGLGDIGKRPASGRHVDNWIEVISKDVGCPLATSCLRCPRPSCVLDEPLGNRPTSLKELALD